MKNFFTLLSLLLLIGYSMQVKAQTPATRTTVLGLGVTTCGGATRGVVPFSYNAATNVLTQGTVCTPTLTASGSSGTFSTSRSGIEFNPKDRLLYYYKKVNVSGTDNTYIWRWDPAGACPVNLAIFQTFLGENLTLAFDAAGNGWVIKFTPQATTPVTNLLSMRRIDFTTLTISPSVNITLPAGVNIYTSSGDYLITPGGKMFFAYDNKLMTVNYQTFDGVNPLTATYIDTIKLPSAGQNLVGLAYANGEFVGHFQRSGACAYGEIDILTGVRTAVTVSGGSFASVDNSSVTSGVGVAKKLVSVTPHATIAGRYTVAYDVFVKNYGNYPVNSVQVIDSLQFINGLANVVPGTISTSISGTSGLTLNAGYNGTTNANLLTAGQTLVNTPAANNNFTIRVTADITNIVPGIIYYNSAVATGTGYGGAALRDSSANGASPDLDLNEKPDDAGEAVKTPFVITVASETPPCSNLTTVLHSQNFNTAANQATMPAGSTSQYTGSLTVPLANENFVITNNPNTHNTTYWNSMTDHSGTGRMMVVNADVNASVLYSATINGLCSNLKYSFSAWAANISNAAQVTFCNAVGGFKYPKLNFRVKDAGTGVILTSISTGDITSGAWTEYGMRFVLPTGYPNLTIEIINEGEGGCGNDVALDDVQFGLCDPAPSVVLNTPASGCIGGSTVFSATLSDPTVISGTIEYQWQESVAAAGPWTDILGATSGTYTIANLNASHLKYYRVLIASSGNILNASCRYTSPGYLLTAKTASTAPTSILQSRTAICSGDPVRLTVNGGSLGTNAVWVWYTGSCGGTLIGTGTNIIVNPTVATTYYVRAEGDCNNTSCAQVTLTMNCDIDDDDDGIPDYVEGNGTDPSADVDSDGILNYLDTDFAGFVDTNSDGVNDIFDADMDGISNHLDLDSDNDGIPDVVESLGVDVNGDGRIDNYTDTDADGFSQNVDGNNTGPASSGNGLGAVDTDGDSAPNYFDLDSDNDGIPDVIEAYGTDTNNNGRIDGYADTDADGFSNNVDGDVGNDGTAENAANTLLRTGADVNADGRADSYTYRNIDADSRPNPYDLDSDGDGITDVKEAAFGDTDWNGRVDGSYNTNGWSTVIAALGALNMPNTDATGRVNVYDIDSDEDGIPDNIEGQTTNGYFMSSAVDTDLDGITNTYDNFAGFGGDGTHPVDTDGETVPDYLDADTDNDGINDIIEGNDFNLNGYPDDNVTLTGLDADDDGLDNRFDMNNSAARGTSGYMGNGGAITGDASPGSYTVVQRSALGAIAGCGTERDWRCLGFVLKCEIIAFKAVLQNQSVQLDWKALCRQEVDHFIVQRSTDRVSFSDVGVVAGKPVLNEIEFYSGTDDIHTLEGNVVYYRLKAVMPNGETSISSVISVRRDSKKDNTVLVYPNPVHDQLQVSVNAVTSYITQIYILDGNGKPIKKYQEKVLPGNNVFTYTETRNLPNGVYYIRLNLGEQLIIQKFSVLK